MEVKKILKINVSDFRNIQVLGAVSAEEAQTHPGTYFKVYAPSMFSLESTKCIRNFLERTLQTNHKWSYQDNKILIDNIEYEIKNDVLGNFLESQLTYKKFKLYATNMPRNNFKVYQEFLYFIIGEEERLSFKDKIAATLLANGIRKEHFHTEEVYFTKSGFKVQCVSYRHERVADDIYPNFELFYNSKDKTVTFNGFLHGEGEIYYSGDELEPLSELENNLEFYKNRIIAFKELNEKIKNIKFDL